MRRILLVSRVSGVKDELNRRLSAAGEAATVFAADTTAEARKFLQELAFDLVIVDIHAPAEVDAPVAADATPGLELVQWMREGGNDTDCVLMRPRALHDTPELDQAIAALPRCASVQQGMQLYDDLLAAVRAFPAAEPAKEHEAVEIALWLSGNQPGAGENRYAISVKGSGAPKTDALQLDKLDMQTLRVLTKGVAVMPEDTRQSWKKAFREIGRLLKNELNANANFCQDLDDALTEIGHPGHYEYAHLRFVIPRELHAIALESIVDLQKLKDEKDDSDLWMLEAPVYRVLSGDGISGTQVGPLFGNLRRAPLRCLVIDANIDTEQGIVTDESDPDHEGHKLVLHRLDLVSEECDELYATLKRQMKQLNIAEPVLLQRKRGEQDFLKLVQEHLKQDWDLVHYAGHSYFDEQRSRACVFIQVDDRRVEAVTATRLANQLGSARLVFLSSCESASEGFVFKLAEAGVPAIVGFRWPIKDDQAKAFAECFYTHLFECKSVEQAFFLARVQLHDRQGYAERKAWASPVLIEQKLQD